MHWNTPIYHDGYLYGCRGRNSPDAELRWSNGGQAGQVVIPTPAHIALMYVDRHLSVWRNEEADADQGQSRAV